MIGLVGREAEKIKAASYQYSDSDSAHNPNWIPVDDFKQIYNWKINGTPPVIKWDRTKLGAKVLYDIVSACPSQSLYIGIRGGLRALEDMEKEKIEDSAWQLITADEPPTSSWISGNDFRKVLDGKGM